MTKEELIEEFDTEYDNLKPFIRCLNGKIVKIENVSEYADFPLTVGGSFGFISPEDRKIDFIPYGNYNDSKLYDESEGDLYTFAKLLNDNGYVVFKLYCYQHSGFCISGYERVNEYTEYFDESESRFYALYYNKEGIDKIDGLIKETNYWFDGSIYAIEFYEGNDWEGCMWYYGLSDLEEAIKNFDWECSVDEDIEAEIKAFSSSIIDRISKRAKDKLKEILEKEYE